MITIGSANRIGRFITAVDELAPEPGLDLFAGLGLLQSCRPASSGTSSSASSSGGTALAAACARRARRRCGPSTARQAGSTVIDRIAASITDGDAGVGQRLQEALREQQQTGERGDDQHRRERHGPPRRHHGATHRGLGVVALGDFLSESAHHEQAVVDRDTETDQRDDRLGEEVHRSGEHRDQSQDAQRARRCDRPPTITGRPPATTPPNTKNSTTATSGSASTSARFWSLPMVPVSSLATGCRPASSTLPSSSCLQVGLDRLVVVQDGVVVIALERRW